jgi:hypothetical protein
MLAWTPGIPALHGLSGRGTDCAGRVIISNFFMRFDNFWHVTRLSHISRKLVFGFSHLRQRNIHDGLVCEHQPVFFHE